MSRMDKTYEHFLACVKGGLPWDPDDYSGEFAIRAFIDRTFTAIRVGYKNLFEVNVVEADESEMNNHPFLLYGIEKSSTFLFVWETIRSYIEGLLEGLYSKKRNLYFRMGHTYYQIIIEALETNEQTIF